MARQSITLTPPNDEWLKSQVASQEYINKSEVVNALIRKERERQQQLELIREKLIKAEQSGFSQLSQEEILVKSKEGLRLNGSL